MPKLTGGNNWSKMKVGWEGEPEQVTKPSSSDGADGLGINYDRAKVTGELSNKMSDAAKAIRSQGKPKDVTGAGS